MTAAQSIAVLTTLVVVVVAHRLRPRPDTQRLRTLTGRRRPARPGPSRSPWVLVPWRRPTRHDPADVAAWCDRLARSVRSGDTLATAIRTCAPPADRHGEVGTIVLALDRGVPLGQAVSGIDATDDLALALTVVRACTTTGGPAAEPLDRAAAALRARSAELADGRTQSAQARLSAVVMTILPIALLALLIATSAPVRDVTGSPTGAVVVLLGAALNIGGWRWMRRIIDGAAR